MPKILSKSAAEHFACERAMSDPEMTFVEVIQLAMRVLTNVLRNREVDADLSEILNKKLNQVWQGADHRLPAFIARLNDLVNVHLCPPQSINLKTPPLTAETTIRDYRNAMVRAINTAIKKAGS